MRLSADITAGDLAQLDAFNVPQSPAQLVLRALAADDQGPAAWHLLDVALLGVAEPGEGVAGGRRGGMDINCGLTFPTLEKPWSYTYPLLREHCQTPSPSKTDRFAPAPLEMG